jgi:acyl-CoA thioester hydrolase
MMTAAELPWDYPQPFSLTVDVGAADIDGLQHTNNTVYVKWCERVAWAHSESLGLDLRCYQALDRAMVIRHSEFDYLLASRLGDTVQIATWISANDGKLSMARQFQAIRLEDGATLLRASMKFVCVDLSQGRPRRMPAEFASGYPVTATARLDS